MVPEAQKFLGIDVHALTERPGFHRHGTFSLRFRLGMNFENERFH